MQMNVLRTKQLIQYILDYNTQEYYELPVKDDYKSSYLTLNRSPGVHLDPTQV